MKLRHASAVLAFAACTASALPAAASAQTDNSNRARIFSVTAEGSGSYAYNDVWETLPGLQSEIHNKVDFKWKTKLPAVVVFSNGHASITGYEEGAVSGTVTATASAETIIRGLDGKGNTVTTRGYCETKGATQPILAALVTPSPAADGANFTVRPFDSLTFGANCTAAIYNGAADISVNAAPGALDQRFNLPREATRQGKIIQLVEAEPNQRNHCNLPGSWGVATCSLDWHGTLTFEFVGYYGGSSSPEAPDELELPPGPGEAPGSDLPDPEDIPLPPGPGKTPGSDLPDPEDIPLPPGPGEAPDPDLIELPMPSGAKASKKAGTASVNVTCARACAGTVSAFTAGGVHGSAAAKPLAQARFKATAGKAKTVTLRFRGAALRKVRKAKSLRLVIDTGSAKKTVVVKPR